MNCTEPLLLILRLDFLLLADILQAAVFAEKYCSAVGLPLGRRAAHHEHIAQIKQALVDFGFKLL